MSRMTGRLDSKQNIYTDEGDLGSELDASKSI